MKHGKSLAIAAIVAALVGSAGTAAVAEHDADTKAGQFCGQGEHGMVWPVENAAGEKVTLACRPDGNVWRWVDIGTSEEDASEPVVSVPGLTG